MQRSQSRHSERRAEPRKEARSGSLVQTLEARVISSLLRSRPQRVQSLLLRIEQLPHNRRFMETFQKRVLRVKQHCDRSAYLLKAQLQRRQSLSVHSFSRIERSLPEEVREEQGQSLEEQRLQIESLRNLLNRSKADLHVYRLLAEHSNDLVAQLKEEHRRLQNQQDALGRIAQPQAKGQLGLQLKLQQLKQQLQEKIWVSKAINYKKGKPPLLQLFLTRPRHSQPLATQKQIKDCCLELAAVELSLEGANQCLKPLGVANFESLLKLDAHFDSAAMRNGQDLACKEQEREGLKIALKRMSAKERLGEKSEGGGSWEQEDKLARECKELRGRVSRMEQQSKLRLKTASLFRQVGLRLATARLLELGQGEAGRLMGLLRELKRKLC